MAVCVYDNPATMRREAWQNGCCIAFITADLMARKEFEGHPTIFFGLNVGRNFTPGQVIGDAQAKEPPCVCP